MALRRIGVASFALATLAFASTAHALNVTPSSDAGALANAILGSGSAIQITSVSYSGAAAASGLYTDGPQGIANGALLTTGTAADALPPNDSDATGTINGLPGHPLCNALVPEYETYDATVLSITFDLAPGYNGISLNSVFGSEEYPEWVDTLFNDVYGVYLNGEQVVFDDSGNSITINGPFFSGGSVVLPPANGTEYDGTTGLLNTRAPLTGGSTGNVLEIVICDGGDSSYDSGAFITGLTGCLGEDCIGTVSCESIDNDEDGVNACDDCDDANANTYPGATEVCDQLDNDCNEDVDDGGVCAPTCVTIQRGTFGSVQDASIYANSPHYNGGTYTSLYTGWDSTSGAKYALVRFDLGVIPQGAAVTSASFGIKQEWSSSVAEVRVHQILAPWTETGVNYQNFANHFDPAVLGSFNTVSGVGSHAVDVTYTVGDWVAGLEANHGFLLEENLVTKHSYRSSEHPSVAERPYLQVCYVGGN